MESTSKKLVKISIQRPGSRLVSVMEKNGKACMPTTDAKRSTKKQGFPEKAESKIILIHKPVTRKAVKHLPWGEVCLTLCKFPECTADATTAAKLLLLVLLSQVAHLLVGVAPMLPAICLDKSSSGVSSLLGVLLRAVQGPEEWHGDDWRLLRPWIVRPRLSLRETAPSATLSDYIGGKLQTPAGEKRTFCYPYIDSTMVLAPGLPSVIEKALVAYSPLSLPIVFDRKDAVKGRFMLEWKTNSFVSYDATGIEKLRELGHSCYLEITLFLQWFCEKKKRIKRWKSDFDTFRPVIRNGRFTTPTSDEQTELLCAALALFRQFLVYASEKNDWLPQEEAREMMLQYWRWVLPESAPKEDDGQDKPVELNYASPDVFYQFLTEWFLPTYHKQILQAAKGAQGTMGLIRKLDGATIFIAPRQIFLETYGQWLNDHSSSTLDLSMVHGDAVAQRKLLEAGIPLKGETKNPATWRYPFYGRDKTVNGSGMIGCFALPIPQLPEGVQGVFRDLFEAGYGCGSQSIGSEAVTNSPEGVDPL